MKLIELFEVMEDVPLVKHNMLSVDDLRIAVTNDPYVTLHIKDPTPEQIKLVLTTYSVINNRRLYDDFIKKHLGNNALLTKKWIRYGEAMRNQV
jgi:hypothetical protein